MSEICPGGLRTLVESIELMGGGNDLEKYRTASASKGQEHTRTELLLPSGDKTTALETHAADLMGRPLTFFVVQDDSGENPGLSIFLGFSSSAKGRGLGRKLCTVYPKKFEGKIWTNDGALTGPFIDFVRENKLVLVEPKTEDDIITRFKYCPASGAATGDDTNQATIISTTTKPDREPTWIPWTSETHIYDMQGEEIETQQ